MKRINKRQAKNDVTSIRNETDGIGVQVSTVKKSN